MKSYKGRLSIDTFYSPRIKEEEIFVRFDEYTKLVTREFLDKDEMFKEEEISSMLCNKCDKPLEVIIDWFSDSGRTYYCLGKCPEHGYVRGKIRVKKIRRKTVFFAIKIMKSTDDEGANSIHEKGINREKKTREKNRGLWIKEIVV